MAAQLSSFGKLDSVDGVHTAWKGNLRCTAIVLRDGSVCLFSPVAGLGDIARDSLARLGEVKFLMAPNHYHNKAVAEYVHAFPDATLCAPEAAIPRLEKITGFRPETTDDLEALLGENAALLRSSGLKTGEAWLRIQSADITAWCVVDAFCGPKIDKTGASADAPELLKTFPNFGIADNQVYSEWVMERITTDQPGVIVPCHGSVIRSRDLPAKLEHLVRSRL